MTNEERKALALRVAKQLDQYASGEDFPLWLETPDEACALASMLREVAEGGWQPKYFLSRDNDSHWYIVPVANAAEWEDWVAIPEDDERAWDVPSFAHRIGGAPCLVTFTAPEVEGRPLPAPPAEEGK